MPVGWSRSGSPETRRGFVRYRLRAVGGCINLGWQTQRVTPGQASVFGGVGVPEVGVVIVVVLLLTGCGALVVPVAGSLVSPGQIVS